MIQTPKIYKIDCSHYKLKNINTDIDIIKVIINEGFLKLKLKKEISILDLQKYELEGLVYFLYTFKFNEKESEWKDFLPKPLTKLGDFFEEKITLILFVKTDRFLFVVIGGNAYNFIVPFIDHSFGLDLYSRIIDPKEDEILSIKSRGLTGNRAGINEQYRPNFRIIDFIRFGKIPQEINIKLSEKVSREFFSFLLQNESEKLLVNVGKAFKIKKSIDFDLLHKTISEIDTILELAPSDYLSSYSEIKEKEFLTGFLKPKLEELIFADLEYIGMPHSVNDKRFQFDFSNPNSIEKYYEADKYVLKARNNDGKLEVFATLSDKDLVYNRIMEEGLRRFGLNNRESFVFFLNGVKILLYIDNKYLTGSNFFYHINAEIQLNGKSYFLLDTKWYLLRDSFLEDLDINTSHILGYYKLDSLILNEPWNKQVIRKEKDYNLLYVEKMNYLVLDTVLVNGIELCDILFFDENQIYLIHVKYGFDSKIRELVNQITLSAKRLKDDLATENKLFLKEIFEKLSKKGRNNNIENFEIFLSLFNKKIKYVLAYTSHLNSDDDISENLGKYKSTIAKYSIIECSSEMRINYYDLHTFQILGK